MKLPTALSAGGVLAATEVIISGKVDNAYSYIYRF